MEDKFDNMYEGRFEALQKKYEAEIAIAKSELDTYFSLGMGVAEHPHIICLLYTSPSPRDKRQSRMPSSA